MKFKKSLILGLGLPVAMFIVSGMSTPARAEQPLRTAPMCVCKVVVPARMPMMRLYRIRPANLRLSANDAVLLMRARLIRHGNRKVTVGKIETIKKAHHNNYRIDLIKDNKVVRTILLNGRTGRMRVVS